MCRPFTIDGKEVPGGRRCPAGCAGSGGSEYIDERMRQSVDPEAETQKFSQVHKEVLEESKGTKTKEELEKAVGPQDFDNFHRVVSKMISQSDMTDHDKMIARRKWNRAEQEVQQGQVTEVTLKTWEKMVAGTVLFMIDRIDSKGRKVQWRQLSRALKASVSVREYAHSGEQVVPEGYDSYEEFIQSLEAEDARGEAMDWKDKETLDQARSQNLNPDEVPSNESVLDGKTQSNPEFLPVPDDFQVGEDVKKQEWTGPQSFARRPKSERGAHKAGKPVKEATIFDETPSEPISEAPNTQQIPKVTVTPIHESKLSARLNAIDNN